MIRAGIIGYGGMGHLHAANLAQIDGVSIVAVCDIDESKLTAGMVSTNLDAPSGAIDMSSVTTYTDGETMFKSENLDLVVSCLPSFEHARYAIMALDAGANVFSEKPMALTVSECDDMIAARDRSGKILMIGQCMRFWPGWDTVKQFVDTGELGRLLTLKLDRFGALPGWTRDANWFLDESKSGGCVLDLHLHDADYVNFLFGFPETIQAVGLHDPKRGGWTDIHAHYVYPDGPIISMHGGWDYHSPFAMALRAEFEDGVLEHGKDGVTVYRNGGEVTPMDVSPKSGHRLEMEYLIDCIQHATPPTRCLPESCARSVRLIDLTRQAMETRHEVTVPNDQN